MGLGLGLNLGLSSAISKRVDLEKNAFEVDSSNLHSRAGFYPGQILPAYLKSIFLHL